MDNGSDAKHDSSGELFVRRVARCGVVLKFKVGKYGRLPNEGVVLSSQELSLSDSESGSDTLENVAVSNAENTTPLLEKSEIGNNYSENGIPLLKNTAVEIPEKGIHGVTEVNNVVMEIEGIASLENVATDNTVIRINEIGSSQNPKADNAEAGGACGSEAQVCHQCGKSFRTINALNGHMASHRRKGYKSLRMKPEPPISPATEKHDFKTIWEASFTLVNISMASEWQPENVADAIDVTSSDDEGSGDMKIKQMMREVAEILITLPQTVSEDTVQAAPPVLEGGFMCTTCHKSFPTYQALGGHKSNHNKAKHSRLDDGASSSSGGGDRCSWKYLCNKCGLWFPTGQALGGHKRRHWLEQYRMMPLTEENVQPSATLADDTVKPPGPVVLPTDLNMQPSMPLVGAAEELPAPVIAPEILGPRDRGFDLNELPPSEDMEP